MSLGCVLAILLGLVVQGYRRGSTVRPAPPLSPQGGPQASLRLNGFHVTETAADRTRWDLRAAQGEYFKERQVTLLRDVEVTFFSRDGRTLTLRGDAGRLANDTKNIALSGNVVATSSDGYRVTTGALDYTNRDRMVRGDGPVALVGEAVEVSGVGLAIQVEEQTVAIPRQVTSVLQRLEATGGPESRGPRGRLDGERTAATGPAPVDVRAR